MAAGSTKSPSAFLTIGEMATELGLPKHILRYWETRFTQLKPLQRAGNRRYYRPEDADLARQINRWLNGEGYTVKGVQKLLAGGKAVEPSAGAAVPLPPAASSPSLTPALTAIRDRLSRALAQDDVAARV